jgi:hypothetical protein
MDIIFFIIKYIPFWSVPAMVIGGYFFYLYWLKDIREIAFVFASVVALSFFSLTFWIATGGFNGSVQYIQEFQKADM